MTIAERMKAAGVSASAAALIPACEAAAAQFRLPFNRQQWRGQAGNWAGAGVGSSIDFQDHRPYVPGDDPRYINWQAYARSGHYTMKLYREEVRPQVDLVLDVSDSVFVEPQKAVRALELFHFVCHSAWRSGALLNANLVDGSAVNRLQTDALRGGDWQLPEKPAASALSRDSRPATPDWSRIAWSTQGMRIVISDFLFEEAPDEQLFQLVRNGSQTVLFCVYTAAEMRPDWLGNAELLDCESGKRASHYFTAADLEQYHRRYDAHFSAWADAAARRRTSFARINAAGTLAEQLLTAAIPQGGVELCN